LKYVNTSQRFVEMYDSSQQSIKRGLLGVMVPAIGVLSNFINNWVNILSRSDISDTSLSSHKRGCGCARLWEEFGLAGDAEIVVIGAVDFPKRESQLVMVYVTMPFVSRDHR
jgi:hypothetical protein